MDERAVAIEDKALEENLKLKELLRECYRGYEVEITVNRGNTWALVMEKKLRGVLKKKG